MKPIYLFLILFVLLLLFVLIGAFLCYHLAFSVSKKRIGDAHHLPKGEQYDTVHDESIAMIDRILALPYEDVWITSYDGLRLHGKYYRTEHPCAGPKTVEILFHGYRSMAERDFSGGLLLPLDAGYDALLIDQRAHGQSDGKYLSFGVKERLDCRAWVEYTVSRCGADVRILLTGISMGAATVLMASALPFDGHVRGIIADCGYSSPDEIIHKVVKELSYPEPLVMPLLRIGAVIYGGFRLGRHGIRAEDELRKTAIPVLFIHGEDDRFVPCEMSRKNYDACASSHKVLLTVPDAGHGLSFMIDNETYVRTVQEFTAAVLG